MKTNNNIKASLYAALKTDQLTSKQFMLGLTRLNGTFFIGQKSAIYNQNALLSIKYPTRQRLRGLYEITNIREKKNA